MWVFVFILFVVLLFTPQGTTEPFVDKLDVCNVQRSTLHKEPEQVTDYFENPLMNCPQEYEIAMDTLKEIEPKEVYYGYTGSHHIDTRYIDWTKVKEPLPVFADFFM